MADIIEKALRQYATTQPLDQITAHELQCDLLAIAGDEHVHVKSIFHRDQCAICCRDIRDEIHTRISDDG